MRFNLNTHENLELLLFPDNQPHVKIGVDDASIPVEVVCSITDSKKLLELCMLSDCLENVFGRHAKDILHIPYLMGARFDRIMQPGDSFDLKVIAKIINSLNFDTVVLYDPHSDVAPALIERSLVITNERLVKAYTKERAMLIIPDAGAAKKADNYFKWSPGIVQSIQCNKHRDVSSGDLTIAVPDRNVCEGKDCVIIDDLCDGGGTFLLIADKVLPCKPRSLTLIVTHGLFTKGFKELDKRFDEIITSNSLLKSYDSKKVKIVDYDFTY